MTDIEIRNIIKKEMAKGGAVPVGAIFAFPSECIPDGYLECNGQELSKNHYPELFNLIGYTFGGEKNTFLLPDLQGQFIRGLDREGNWDCDEEGNIRTLGSIQQDSLQGHRHSAARTSSDGSHSHKSYADKIPIRYGKNTFSDNESATVPYFKSTSFYDEHKNDSWYDFEVIESSGGGGHTHGVSVLGASDDSYGKVRVDSETRPINMALVYCIKVK